MSIRERVAMGHDGPNAAEILYNTVDENGVRALPEPTGAALKAATIDVVDAKIIEIDEHLAGSSVELGEALSAKIVEVDDRLDAADATVAAKLVVVDDRLDAADVTVAAKLDEADTKIAETEQARQNAQAQANAIGNISGAVAATAADAGRSETARAASELAASVASAAVATAAKAEAFETVDPIALSGLPAAGVALLDNQGRIAGVVPSKSIDVSRVPNAEVFEAIIQPGASVPQLIDIDRRILSTAPDPALPTRVSAAEASLATLLPLVGQGALAIEAFEQIIAPGSTGVLPLVLDKNGRAIVQSGDTSAIATVAAQLATFSTAISGRMDVFHDPSGAPDVQNYQTWRMRRARMKLRMLQSGLPVQLSLTFFGDSYIDGGESWFLIFAAAMYAKYGRAAVGWFGFGTTKRLVGSTEASGSPAGDVVVVDGGVASPDTYAITTSVIGTAKIFTLPSTEPRPTSARLMWEGTADGVIRYRWHAADTWKEQPVQGSGVQSALLDVSGMPALGTGIKLQIELVAGSYKLFGVYYGGNGTGVIINKCGNSGTRAFEWAAIPEAQQVAAWSLIPTDAAHVLHGTNDNAGSSQRSAAQFAGDITTFATRARLAYPPAVVANPPVPGAMMPGCDFVTILPQDITPSAARPIMNYVRAIRAIAPVIDSAVVALGYSFGFDPNAYRGWLDDSAYHPNAESGVYLAADPILSLYNA